MKNLTSFTSPFKTAKCVIPAIKSTPSICSKLQLLLNQTLLELAIGQTTRFVFLFFDFVQKCFQSFHSTVTLWLINLFRFLVCELTVNQYLAVVQVVLCKVFQAFESVNEILKCDWSNDRGAFPVVLFTMTCKFVLTFESVDEILKCDHLNESY